MFGAMEELDHLSLFGEYFEIVCGTTEEFLIAFSMKYGKVSYMFIFLWVKISVFDEIISFSDIKVAIVMIAVMTWLDQK